MRRRDVSSKELAKIINLRKMDTSWLKIQCATHIPRRIAKRAYENWSRIQSRGELKAAREDVAAEEFRKHLECLVKMAEALVNALDVPQPSPPLISADDTLLNRLWGTDIVGEYGVYGPSRVGSGPDLYGPKTWGRVRQNQILLKSLQSHTHEMVDWQLFDHWKKAWDECISSQGMLKQEAYKILLNFFNQESGLTDRIMRGSRKKDVVDRMANGVVYVIWQGILAGRPDQLPSVEVINRGGGTLEVIFDKDEPSLSLIFTGADLAKKVKDTCIQAANNLRIQRRDDISTSVDHVRRMREIIDKFTETLNPLMLRPQILRTRCDLCPA